jgi:small-conductance mechanosensitive channel
MEKFNEYIEQLVAEWLQRLTGKDSDVLTKILVTVIILLILWIIRRLALNALHRFYFKRGNLESFYHWKNGLTYATYIFGILLIGQTWFANFQSLATYLGLLSAGLAVALQGPITNLAGWTFIFWRKPFEVGDRIEIGNNSGDVIDIRVFQFTIIEIGNWVDADQTTGRLIHIPNSKVFNEPIANFTTGFNYIWNEVPVLITFESNWRKAKQILQAIVSEHAATVSEDAE